MRSIALSALFNVPKANVCSSRVPEGNIAAMAGADSPASNGAIVNLSGSIPALRMASATFGSMGVVSPGARGTRRYFFEPFNFPS